MRQNPLALLCLVGLILISSTLLIGACRDKALAPVPATQAAELSVLYESKIVGEDGLVYNIVLRDAKPGVWLSVYSNDSKSSFVTIDAMDTNMDQRWDSYNVFWKAMERDPTFEGDKSNPPDPKALDLVTQAIGQIIFAGKLPPSLSPK